MSESLIFTLPSLSLQRKDVAHDPPEPDPEPLTAVLSGRSAGTGGQQKDLSFTNPGLDTTDL